MGNPIPGYGASEYVPTSTSTPMKYFLDDTGYTAVATDEDGLRDEVSGASARIGFHFTEKNANSTDDIAITWDGQVSQTNLTTTLEIYNFTTGRWQSYATNTTPTADNDFTLSATIDSSASVAISSSLDRFFDFGSGTTTLATTTISQSGGGGTPADYYNPGSVVFVRVVTATSSATTHTFLRTDEIDITFSAGGGGGSTPITAANDIRLQIGSSTMPMIFHNGQNFLTCLDGNACYKIASDTIIYSGDGKTVFIDVTEDFTDGDSITFGSLKVGKFDSVIAATTTMKIDADKNGTPDDTDDKTITVKGVIQLYGTSSPETVGIDQFSTAPSHTQKDLYAFVIVPQGENASTTLVVNWAGSGVVQGDIANPKLYWDRNQNGVVDTDNPDPQLFGNGTVDASTISFSATTTATTTPQRFIMRADVLNLIAGDTLTFTLSRENVIAIGSTSQTYTSNLTVSSSSPSLSTSVTHTQDTITQRAFIFTNDDGSTVATGTTLAATNTAPTSVKIGQRMILRYQIDNTSNATTVNQYKLEWENNTDDADTWNDFGTTTQMRHSLSKNGLNQKGITGRGLPIATSAPSVDSVCQAGGAVYNGGWFYGGVATSSLVGMPPNTCADLAFAIDTGLALANRTYRFRLVDGVTNQTLTTYSQYASLGIETTQTLSHSKGAYGTSTIRAIEADVNDGRDPSITIGQDGLPIVAFQDATSNGTLKILKCGTMNCIPSGSATNTIQHIESNSSGSGFTPSIAIGQDGLPVVAYQDRTGAGTLKILKCGTINCIPSGSATNTIQHIEADTLNGYNPSIAIGQDGLPVVAYQDLTGFNYTLKILKCGTINCIPSGSATNTIQHIEADASNGWTPSIAIGQDGLPVVAFQDRTNVSSMALKVLRCGTSNCVPSGSATNTIQTIGTGGNGTSEGYGHNPSVVIGQDGLPIVVFQDSTNQSVDSLRAIKCGTPDCNPSGSIPNTTRVIEASNNNGFNPSLTIGQDGLPVIVYVDATNANADTLKVVKCGNVYCGSPAGDAQGGAIPGYGASEYLSTATVTPLHVSLDSSGYRAASADDGEYETVGGSASELAFQFSAKQDNNTKEFVIEWNGRVSESKATRLELYRFGSVNAWQTATTHPNPVANQDFWLSANVVDDVSDYYEPNSNRLYARAVMATSSATAYSTLKTDFIRIPVGKEVTMDSAYSQAFGVDDPVTAAAPITISVNAHQKATSTTGLRITIPTNIATEWDTTDDTPSYGGNAYGKIAPTVSYTADKKTLIVTIVSDFVTGDILEIGGLSFANFSEVSGPARLELYTGGADDAEVDSIDGKIKNVVGGPGRGSTTPGEGAPPFQIAPGGGTLQGGGGASEGEGGGGFEIPPGGGDPGSGGGTEPSE